MGARATDVAAGFGVSRAGVNQAMGLLVEDDFVSKRPGKKGDMPYYGE